MEDRSLEESMILALDGKDKNILRYIPYILQDFWEIGTSAGDVIKVIKKYKQNYSKLTVLDLGSGKGAVSIKISSELKCKCHGIDGMEEFIAFSIKKALEYSVENLCSFNKADIRTEITSLGKYDIIVLGAIGDALGDYYNTLLQLKDYVNTDGLIIIDDAYIEDNLEHSKYLKKNDLIKKTKMAGLELIEIVTYEENNELNAEYDNEFINLKKRCIELIEKHPMEKTLFLEFIENQKNEYDVLKNDIIPAMFVVKNNVDLI